MPSRPEIVAAYIIENGQIMGENTVGKATNVQETCANIIFPKIPRDDHRRTLKKAPYEFHYKFSSNRAYFAVSDVGFSQRVVWAFIDEVEKDYVRVALASNYRIASKILKNQMEFHNNPANDKILDLQNKMSGVRDVMIENLDKLIDRENQLAIGVEKSRELLETGVEFRTGTRTVKRRNYCILISFIIGIIVTILVAIVILVIIICAASKCFHKKK